MRLPELYKLLFGETLANQHNALSDAEATRKCYFELVRKGEITDEVITKQWRASQRRWELPIWVVVLISVIVVTIFASVLFLFF